ncbi:hypothetical protein HMPREF0083_05867 [Aneurinibacillus aneurinilyticus ATCC 12856]|uniref:Uncharacterized protein n=1 Tax=Aneurinibacillus aneurinilyticus ATCC 12856 TaxID=649747 RepID=U1W8Y9_ANEAE|nr:hypothetical protein HMPREF0083_05867 [Aneurinibacillus aneurinilyticus ATCC 12856]
MKLSKEGKIGRYFRIILNEESYFTLMQLYDSLGDRDRMEEQYWLLISYT